MIEARNKPPRRDERRRARDQKRWPAKQKAHHPGKMAGFKMNSQEQSAKANSKTKPMIAPVLACHNGGKPKGPVCRNTFGRAFATHDDTVGFVAPKFLIQLNFEPVDQCPNSDIGMVLGKMGHTARLAAWLFPCYEHLAHPLFVVVQRVVPSSVRRGTKTMMQAASLRPSAQLAHHGHTLPTYRDTPAHVDNFNRDVLAVGNAENAIARVLFELRKPQPDNARALKLAQAALMAVQYVGVEVLQ